jgi:hypothetical protein
MIRMPPGHQNSIQHYTNGFELCGFDMALTPDCLGNNILQLIAVDHGHYRHSAAII